MRAAIFTGSATGNNAVFAQRAASLAGVLARKDIGIVYGGGGVGLMGVIATSALAHGGEVIGVMPASLVDRELAQPNLTRLEIVSSMHERKARMAELSDVFIALPGGTGTLEEFFEVWTWQQLGIHAKPVALYNIEGFWAPLISTIDAGVTAGFLKPAFRDALIVSDDPRDLLDQIAAWTPPTHKWSTPPERNVA